MIRVLHILLIGVSLHLTTELQCWTCQNQPSMFHCMFTGEIKTCQSNQMSCRTDVRRCGPKFIFMKGCKQTAACRSDARSQVTPDINGMTQCNADQESSICTCCCSGERCNLNSNPCNGMEFDCQPRGSVEDVNITCTDGSSTGSVCSYECNEPNYIPYPSNFSTCLNYGEWSMPLPCCARICPPFLLNDILFMYSPRSSEDWSKFLSEIAEFSFRFRIGARSARVGVVSYGSKVNLGQDEAIVFNETAARNRGAFQRTVQNISFVNDTTGEMNAGAALDFAGEDLFSEAMGDRPNIRNIIVLQLDDVSTDNVTEVAKSLREQGFTIYVIASTSNTNEAYTQQLLDIAGSVGNVIFDDEINGIGFIGVLTGSLCRNPCSNEELPALQTFRSGFR